MRLLVLIYLIAQNAVGLYKIPVNFVYARSMYREDTQRSEAEQRIIPMKTEAEVLICNPAVSV